MNELLKVLSRHRGKEKAISAKDLARLLNWPKGRVMEQINRARDAGILICSEQNTQHKAGYYLPANKEEAYLSVQKQVKSARRKWKLAKAQKQAYLDTFEQKGEQLDLLESK